MKIGIPIFDLISTVQLSGVEKYAHNLLVHMMKLNYGQEFIVYKGFRQNPGKFGEFKTRRVIQKYVPKIMRRLAFEMDGINVLHLPVYFENMPFLKKGKNIVTIHDVVPLINADISKEGLPEYFNSLRSELSRIDMFIAVSEHTKKDIITYLGVPERRIKVIYEAADERYRPLPDSRSKQKYGTERIILFVGTLEPRKNLPTLIRAFARLNRKDCKLLIAGKKGWRYEAISETVEKLGLKDRIVFLGYVPDEELPELYNAADVFVYPSLYEGFGLPPLEAMACGTPVIVSNRSSLPEVVGDAGILVEPEDADEMSRAIERILRHASLREELSQKGLRRSERFSWKQCAAETLALYKEVH